MLPLLTIAPPTFWTAGNEHGIELGIAVIIGTIIELKFSILKRLKSIEGTLFGRPFPIWMFGSSVLCAFWFTDLYFFAKFDQNILLVRMFNFVPGFLGSGKWTTWAIIAVVYARYGWDDFVGGGVVLALFGSIHEIFWYVAYTVSYPAFASLAIPYYSPFIFDLTVFPVCYYLLSRHGSVRKIPRSTIVMTCAVVVVMDALWVLAGFPISIDLVTGMTPLYKDIMTGFAEAITWVTPGVVFCFPFVWSKSKKPEQNHAEHSNNATSQQPLQKLVVIRIHQVSESLAQSFRAWRRLESEDRAGP